MALHQPQPSVVIHQAIEPSSRNFPVQRVSVRRGIYEYLCTFFFTTIILGGLMVAGPAGIEGFIIKLFQGQTQSVQQVIANPLGKP